MKNFILACAALAAPALADTFTTLNVDSHRFSNRDIEQYVDDMYLDDRTYAFMLATSPTRKDLDSKLREFTEKNYDRALREWAFNRIFQDEASKLGYVVLEEALSQKVEKELEGTLSHYTAKGLNRAEALKALGDDLIKAQYPFPEDAKAAERARPDFFARWREKKVRQVLENMRRDFARSGMHALIEMKYGAPHARPADVRAMWKRAGERFEKLRTAPATDKLAALADPEYAPFVKNARAFVKNIYVAVRPLAEYGKDPELGKKRQAQMLEIAARVLSTKTLDQLFSDLDFSKKVAAKYSLETLQQQREANRDKYSLSADPKSDLLARLYGIAAFLKEAKVKGEEAESRAALEAAFNAARSHLTAQPEILTGPGKDERPFTAVVSELLHDEFAHAKIVADDGAPTLKGLLGDLALAEASQALDLEALKLSAGLAEEFFRDFARDTSDGKGQRLRVDFEKAAAYFTQHHPIESARKDTGWLSFGERSSGLHSFVFGEGTVPAADGKVAYQFDHSGGVPLVNIMGLAESEEEEFLNSEDGDASKRVTQLLEDRELGEKLGRLRKDLLKEHFVEVRPSGSEHILSGAEAENFLLAP